MPENPQYAAHTKVPVSQSKTELDTLLAKYGCTSRGIVANDTEGRVLVGFHLGGRSYRMTVPLPKLGDYPRPRPRGWNDWNDAKQARARYEAWEQACRQRWRVVVLHVRSKLEAIAAGWSTAEREFMADLVLADGRTVAEVLADGGAKLLPPPETRPPELAGEIVGGRS